MAGVPKCASCRAGENDVEADVFVVGKVPRDRFTDSCSTLPYRAWLCVDHWDMLVDDGAELRVQRSLTPYVVAGAERSTR